MKKLGLAIVFSLMTGACSHAVSDSHSAELGIGDKGSVLDGNKGLGRSDREILEDAIFEARRRDRYVAAQFDRALSAALSEYPVGAVNGRIAIRIPLEEFLADARVQNRLGRLAPRFSPTELADPNLHERLDGLCLIDVAQYEDMLFEHFADIEADMAQFEALLGYLEQLKDSFLEGGWSDIPTDVLNTIGELVFGLWDRGTDMNEEMSDGFRGGDTMFTVWEAQDIDGDGIPNGQDGDRDGDGVENHRDRYPNDPTAGTSDQTTFSTNRDNRDPSQCNRPGCVINENERDPNRDTDEDESNGRTSTDDDEGDDIWCPSDDCGVVQIVIGSEDALIGPEQAMQDQLALMLADLYDRMPADSFGHH